MPPLLINPAFLRHLPILVSFVFAMIVFLQPVTLEDKLGQSELSIRGVYRFYRGYLFYLLSLY